MYLEPLTSLNWAFQLRYYLCFRTHRRHRHFQEQDRGDRLLHHLGEICRNHDYHLLRSKSYPDHLRCLVSLQPQHDISTVIQTLKANLSRQLGSEFGVPPPLWARGYLARTIGRVRLGDVKRYIHSQPEHHGCASRLRPPVFRYRAPETIPLSAARGNFELNYHLVLGTRFRRSVFGLNSGARLGEYCLKVAAMRGFAIDQMTIVPDHVHLVVQTVPKMSLETCALS